MEYKFPKPNKCCFKKNNQIVIFKDWSYICDKCGRYTYDFGGNQLNKKASFERIKDFLKTLNYKREIKEVKTKED